MKYVMDIDIEKRDIYIYSPQGEQIRPFEQI